MRLLICLSLCLFSLGSLAAAEGGGVGLGPALILVRDLVPGETIDIGALSNIQHSLVNNTGKKVDLEIAVKRPDNYGFSQFECGYEPIDPRIILSLKREGKEAASHQFSLDPDERGGASLVLQVPEEPDLWNRHFVVYIEGGAPSKVAMGAALRMRARILIETAARSIPETVPPSESQASIALSPSLITMQGQDTGSWNGQCLLQNNSNHEQIFDLIALKDVYHGKDSDKRMRFFENSKHALMNEQWAIAEQASVVLAAGDSQKLTFHSSTQKADFNTFKTWMDEIFFVARRYKQESHTPEEAKPELRQINGIDYDRIELLRLRYQKDMP